MIGRAICLVAALVLALAAPVAAFNVASYQGPQELGAVTRSSSLTESFQVILATSYTVQAGVVVTTPSTGLFVYATTEINIQGTINADGRGSAAGGLGAAGGGGQGNGGAGTTGTAGAAGGLRMSQTNRFSLQNHWMSSFGSATNNEYRGAGGGGGQTGVAAVSVFGGGAGGGGFCADGGNGGAAGVVSGLSGTGAGGGAGGGAIHLIAPKITIGGSAILTANGANGFNAQGSTPNNSAGGGAGSGGDIVLVGRYVLEAPGSIIRANGGNGGNGGGTGGAGAAGGTGGATGCNSGSNGNSPTNGGGGGGGGAGGQVVRRIDTSNTWQGTWSSGASYSPGDVVYYSNKAYVAKTVHTNQQPDLNADDWDLVAFDGFNALIKKTIEAAGANCAAGGFKVESGVDNGDGGGTARDGTLQAGEVDATEYVCHGEDGPQGPQGLQGPRGYATILADSAEPAGGNCVAGGALLEYGLDDGLPSGTAGDNTLQAGEVEASLYICNGAAIGTWLGDWDDAVTYDSMDIVQWHGAAWIANATSLNAPPDQSPDEWDLFFQGGVAIIPAAGLEIENNMPVLDFWLPIIFWAIVFLLTYWRMHQAGIRYLFPFLFATIGFIGAFVPGIAGLWTMGTCLIGLVFSLHIIALVNKYGAEKDTKESSPSV